MGDVVTGWELGGSAIGLVGLDAIVTGERIEPGDALIGLPSSGLHSNGYTLARTVLADVPLDDERLGRAARRRPARADDDLRPRGARAAGVATPTSAASPTSPATGSTTCCASRDDVGYEISDPLAVPPVFGLIQELGEVSDDEMHEVFNMGWASSAWCRESDADAAVDLLAAHHPGAGASVGSVRHDRPCRSPSSSSRS